jgi:hypothetical protein
MARKPQPAGTDTLPPEMDYPMHERTYSGFLVFLKWGVISVAILMVVLYFLVIHGH